MDLTLPPGLEAELPAALLQGAVTAALALLFWATYYRFPRDYIRWWCLTWTLYTVRMAAILAFFASENAAWLFWHQVLTGWTAIGLLGAALSFGRPSSSLGRLWILAVFPVAWSYVAIYRLDEFLLAAGPAVVFLSLATLGAAWAFWIHHRGVTSPAAVFLAVTLAFWALHHLDYPFLRARGAWAPWGYYLDLLFQGATGYGILFLVLEDYRLGLSTISALAAKILQPASGTQLVRSLLAELCLIPGVDGAALVRRDKPGRGVIVGVGGLEGWNPDPAGQGNDLVPGAQGARSVSRLPVDGPESGRELIRIPVASPEGFEGELVATGMGRHGLVALGEPHLLALGLQVGIALDKADLTDRLVTRTRELEQLAALTVGQHEAERKRISRELHDETAQALAAVRMRLAVLEEELGPDAAPLLEGTTEALREAIASIRRVTSRLRPLVLDELGLMPALRALCRDYGARSDVSVECGCDGDDLDLPEEFELILFRSLQEGLANAMRHSGASHISVWAGLRDGHITLVVQDDGSPPTAQRQQAPSPEFGTGLIGMRERVSHLGGSVVFAKDDAGGRLTVTLPLDAVGEAIE